MYSIQVTNTNSPTWNQSFVYSPIRSSELAARTLEVTVWDFDRCAIILLT